MRLIDADELESYIDAGHLRNPNELCLSENDVISMIRKQKTVDVVRCKDCRYFDFGEDDDGLHPETLCKRWCLPVGEDFYCADGERKECEKE